MEVDLTKELCDQPLTTDQSAAVVTTYEARGRLHEVQTEHRTVESLAMFAEHPQARRAALVTIPLILTRLRPPCHPGYF